MKIIAPAKVNLFLHVGDRQANGLHLIDSIMVFADQNVADRIHLMPASEFKLEIAGEFASDLTLPEDNLITKAIKLLQNITSAPLNYHVKLIKNIPVAAGLGGGSADAGAVLRVLGSQLKLPFETLIKIAISLGSDVPACLLSKPCLVSGQGEKVRLLQKYQSHFAVLVNCGKSCSTAQVFRRYDQICNSSSVKKIKISESLGDFASLVEWLVNNTSNDLEAIARDIVPEISEILETLKSVSGIRLARVSGSGSTCFGLCESKESAEIAASKIANYRPHWWVESVRLGMGQLVELKSRNSNDFVRLFTL